MDARRAGAAWFGLALLVVLAGCGGEGRHRQAASPAPASTTAPAPSGSVDVQDTEAGFSVTIPPNWRRIPLDATTLQQEADAVRADNPRLADTLSSAKDLVGNGGRLLVVSPDGFSNVNVVVTAAGGASLDDVPGPAVARLRDRGAIVQSQERTTVGGTPCFRITLKLPVTPDGAVTVDKTQYYVLGGGKAYVVTLTGNEPALEIVANSLRLT